jgi:hypothetical protein
MDEACPILFVIEFVNASATTVSTRIVLERGDQNVILMYHPCLTVVWVSWVFYFYGYFQWADSWSDLLPTAGPLPVASFWHLFRLHYPWPGPRALTRAPLPNAVIGPSPATPAPSVRHAKQLRWARTRASQPSARTPAIDVARLIAGYPPARLPTQTTS